MWGLCNSNFGGVEFNLLPTIYYVSNLQHKPPIFPQLGLDGVKGAATIYGHNSEQALGHFKVFIFIIVVSASSIPLFAW